MLRDQEALPECGIHTAVDFLPLPLDRELPAGWERKTGGQEDRRMGPAHTRCEGREGRMDGEKWFQMNRPMKLTFPLAYNALSYLSTNAMHCWRENSPEEPDPRERKIHPVSRKTSCPAPHTLARSPGHTWLEDTLIKQVISHCFQELLSSRTSPPQLAHGKWTRQESIITKC